MQKCFFSSQALGLSCALSLGLALVLSIASCGGGGGGSGEGDSSSSSALAELPPDENSPDYEITITAPTRLEGTNKNLVDINVEVRIVSGSVSLKEFDSVLVKLGDQTLNTDKQKGNKGVVASSGITAGRVTFAHEEEYRISEETCGKEYRFSVSVYADGSAPSTVKQEVVTLKGDACIVSSSSVQSSSSVVSRSLVQVMFDDYGETKETVLVSPTIGVNLNAASRVAKADADIYFDNSSSNTSEHKIAANKSTVTIIDQFVRQNAQGEVFCGNKATGETPQNTSEYIPCTDMYPFNTFESTANYVNGRYYLVRTNTSTSWGTGWFLIHATSSTQTGFNLSAWKVQ